MNMIPSLCRVSVLFTGLLLLALPARADSLAGRSSDLSPSPAVTNSQGHTTHTITINYNADANPQWSYTISPANDAKKARVKRNDTILWQCGSGDWKVFFKGPTPLEDASGGALAQVGAGAGVSAGGAVAPKVKKGDVFTYGVSLLLPGASAPVVDDPQIIIED